MKTRRIAAVVAGVVALSACQNPFPKVDPSKPALGPTKKERCQHVVAFSQQPGATDGNQTEMRLIGPSNPAGTSLALWTEEEAHIATNHTCAVNALGTNSGLQVVMAGGGVSKLAEGRVESVAVSPDGKDIYYVLFSDQSHVRKRSLTSPTSDDGWFSLETPEPQYRTEAGSNRSVVAVSFWRMNDGAMPSGAIHLVRHDVELYMDNWQRLSERINHFSLDPATKALAAIKAADGCNRWNPSPSGAYGICINYSAPGDVFVSATADIRDATTGKVVATLPEDLARYAVEPSLTKVDADVLRRPDLYWADAASSGKDKDKDGKHDDDEDEHDDDDEDDDDERSADLFDGNKDKNDKDKNDKDKNDKDDKESSDLDGAILYVVNGRNTDDAKTPKPGAGIFLYDLGTGERTQITNYPVSFWTMAP